MEKAYKFSEIYVLKGNQLSGSILRVLAYSDVFDYPLTASEIFELCDYKGATYKMLKSELDGLNKENYIKKSGIYYYLSDESCIAKREKANRYSEILLQKSQRYSNLISRFPFVRGVCISGSLAKNNAHEDADVDYFIITAKNRLWICRTLLALYKMIFLLNSRKYFCINYFIDTNNLEIMEQNIYTATEIAFLMPVYNQKAFLRFLAANTWVNKYYPEKRIEVRGKLKRTRDSFVKHTIEYILDNKFGNFIDDVCLKLTILYRYLKFRNMDESRFKNNMKALKGVSKHHPHCFQNKVLRKYQDRLISLEAKFGLGLN